MKCPICNFYKLATAITKNKIVISCKKCGYRNERMKNAIETEYGQMSKDSEFDVDALKINKKELRTKFFPEVKKERKKE
jgi:transcription elongation factor Elf1